VLSVFFHELGSKTGSESYLLNQFLVVKWYAKTLRDFPSNGATTASEFTTDGDYLSTHNETSLCKTVDRFRVFCQAVF
jgi:hypothetical protein